jgi:DivIVA domain-containing protein
MIVISGTDPRLTDNRLTPDAVQAVAFPTSRIGRRGFDEEHVRAFCGHVERELARLLDERSSLTDEVARLRRRVLGGDEAGPGHGREDTPIEAARILSTAQRTADRYVADAQEYSRQLADDARRRRDEILAEATSHATMMLEKAHGEASRAAEAALAGPATGPDGRELEGELAYLRTFSDTYRGHLQAYLDALARGAREGQPARQAAAAPPCLAYHLHPQPQPPTG